MCASLSFGRIVVGVAIVWQLVAVIAVRCDAGEARVLKVIDSPGRYQPSPLINDRGEVAVFLAVPSEHPDHGVWVSSQDGTMRQVVRTDSAMPEMPKGATLHLHPHSLQWNDRGQLTFIASWGLQDDYGAGIWQMDLDSKPKMVTERRKPENPTDKLAFQDQLDTVWDLTGQGRSSVFFKVKTHDPGEFEDNPLASIQRLHGRSEYWIRQEGAEPKFVRSVPGDRHDVQASLNSRGDLLEFTRGSQKPRVTLHLIDGPFLNLLDETDAISIGPNSLTVYRIHHASHNVRHEMALVVSAGNQRADVDALLLHDGKQWKPVLYDGPRIEGVPHQPIEMNSRALLNSSGNILFFPQVCHHNKPPTITFIAKDQPPKILVDTSGVAPGMDVPFAIPTVISPQGVDERTVIRSLFENSSPFSAVQFNDQNQFAFIGEVAGRANANPSGIWFGDAATGELNLVVRTGDKRTLPSGETKVIKDLAMDQSGYDGPSARRALNGRGVLTYALQFEDDSIAFVIDDRFAKATSESVATKDSPPVADEKEVERACDDWEQVADQYLTYLESQWADSDQFKLEKLAQELRSEYQDVQRRLALLLSVEEDAEMTPQEYVATVRSLRVRLRELPVIYEALSEWPFYNHPAMRSPAERAYTQASLQLLVDCDLYPALAQRVLAKSQRLNELQQTEIKAAKASGGRIGRGLQPTRAAAFEEPLGTLRPGLLPEFTVSVNPSSEATEIKGPLDEARQPLSQLAAIQIQSNGRLEINRQRWQDATGSMTRDQAKKAAMQLLTRANISHRVLLPREPQIHHMQMLMNRGGGGSPAMDLFLKIQEAMGPHGGSSGGSDGGENVRYSFETERLAGHLRMDEKGLFRLDLNELVAPWRDLRLESQEGRLRIITTSENDVFVLTQASDGEICCVVKSGDQEHIRRAKNFVELYQSQPDFVKKEIIGYLDRLGMGVPPKPEGPEFRAAVLKRLRSGLPAVRLEAEEAIQALSSPEYERRQAAFVTLSKNAELYRTVLEEHLKNNKEVESRVQLERLIAFAQERAGEYGMLIDVFGTLESKSQLEEIKKDANDEERMLIDAQLRQIKGS